MKKVIRSLTWTEAAETQSATRNITHARVDRLLNLRTAERAVFQWILEFFERRAEAPQLKAVIDHFEGLQDVEVITLLEEVTAETLYQGASFLDLLEAEVEEQAAQHLSSTCKTAIKIATQGTKIGPNQVKGTDEAIAYLFSEARGKPATGEGRMPASLTKSAKALEQLYQQRKSNPHQTYGVLTGYGLFDAATAGIRKKQLYLHAGFGGHLKSTHMLNMMINAAVDGGWNPLLFTSEMPAEDVKLMLVAIHSANPRFANAGRPIPAFRLLLGALSPEEEKFFEEVKEDLTTNSSYGSIRVIDSGEFTSFGSIIQRTNREHAEEEVDILWVDYLTRLPLDPKYRGTESTVARNETIADAKRFAMSFNGGLGLAVCTPFQVNREGFKRAKATEGRLDKTALAQYNAAEREADVITYIFFDKDEMSTSEPKIGILKSRYGSTKGDPVSVYIEPESRRIIDMTAGMTISAGYAPTAALKGEDQVTL